MDDAEREDILNDALELFGGEKVDESGVITYGPLQLSVAQKVGIVHTRANVLTRLSSSKEKCVPNFTWSRNQCPQRRTLEPRQTLFSPTNCSLQHYF
jgi:hypothetical protein